MTATETPNMEYANLGSCGLKVSKIILGCMSYGNSQWSKWVKDEEESLKLIKLAYDMGITTWDTADMYSIGASERIVGKALKQFQIPRSHVVILSKCFFGFDENDYVQGTVATNDGQFANRVGLSRKHIFDAVDASVERLGSYIDVLQIHRLDRSIPMEEIMKALHDVVQSGKVRYIGASSMATWEFQMMQNIAEKNGWTKFVSMQNYYNLIYREEEREMIPYCKATGVGIIPWSPLARGVLARPFDERTSIREQTDHYLLYLIRSRENEVDQRTINKVQELADKKGVSMAMVATAWVLQKGFCPIIGLSSEERMKEAIASLSLNLDAEDIEFLEEAYLPKAVVGF